MSKGLRRVLLAAAVVVVVIVGGYIAIRLVQGGSKPKLTLPAVATTPTAAGSTSSTVAGSTVVGSTASTVAGSTASTGATGAVTLDGVWNVSSGSTVGYRVQETLFGVSNTAVGRTSAVTGSFTLSGTTVSAGSFRADLTRVSSDRSVRDDQFQGRIMDTADFPTATLKLTQPIRLSTLPANGVQVTANATGDLTLHGVTKSVSFPVTAQRNGTKIQVAGSIPITFSDYGISNPSGGPATTGDTGTMEFLLDFIHA